METERVDVGMKQQVTLGDKGVRHEPLRKSEDQPSDLCLDGDRNAESKQLPQLPTIEVTETFISFPFSSIFSSNQFIQD